MSVVFFSVMQYSSVWEETSQGMRPRKQNSLGAIVELSCHISNSLNVDFMFLAPRNADIFSFS